jgi:hypothetical protein
MTWAKVDDRAWSNEKLLSLSHEAFRLYHAALSLVAQQWPAGEGCLSRVRAEGLAQWHHIADPGAVIDELVAKKCWEKRSHGLLHVHDIEEFLPPAELSAARAAAGRRGGFAKQRNKAGLASATDLPQQNPSTPSRPVPSRPEGSFTSVKADTMTAEQREVLERGAAELQRDGEAREAELGIPSASIRG